MPAADDPARPWPEPNDPDGLWQVGFHLTAEPPPALLEAMEAMALSASIFADEVDAADQPVRWRVDLLFKLRPEAAALTDEIDQLLADHGLGRTGAIGIDWLPHQDWLAAVRMIRPPLRIGRFYVHGPDDPVPSRPRLVPLLIEAGLAFGSGEHQTTSGCLEAFDKLLRRVPSRAGHGVRLGHSRHCRGQGRSSLHCHGGRQRSAGGGRRS
jgi:ribosomal protein L11 methyltransferase